MHSTHLSWHDYNERDGVSNHRRLDCLRNRLFRRRSKKTSKLCYTCLYEGTPPVTGGFPSQRTSNAQNVSILWRHKIAPNIEANNTFQFHTITLIVTNVDGLVWCWQKGSRSWPPALYTSLAILVVSVIIFWRYLLLADCPFRSQKKPCFLTCISWLSKHQYDVICVFSHSMHGLYTHIYCLEIFAFQFLALDVWTVMHFFSEHCWKCIPLKFLFFTQDYNLSFVVLLF